MNIEAKATYKITKIMRKAYIPALRTAKVGDEIEFKVPIEYIGLGCEGRVLATTVSVMNKRTGLISNHSMNRIGKILNNFEFMEV